jgi:hypothetical protein
MNTSLRSYIAIACSVAALAVGPLCPLVAQKAASAPDASSLAGTFRDISLGSDMASVKELLLADPLFGYRGERDVSLLPGENRALIETSGLGFVKRAWFQFLEDRLYVMTLSLDPEKVDYYSIYSRLVEKYGEPGSLDPKKAVWEGEGVTLSLERPLTVKYLDTETFASLLEKDTTGKAASDISREGFINEF